MLREMLRSFDQPLSKTSTILQTGEAILFNPETKSEIRLKIMFDTFSSRSYITDRVKKF